MSGMTYQFHVQSPVIVSSLPKTFLGNIRGNRLLRKYQEISRYYQETALYDNYIQI